MRDIGEIIQELKNHPDYMVSEIFTWGGYLDQVNDDIYGFLDDIEADNFKPIQKSELTPEQIEEIIDHTRRSIRYIYNPYMIFKRNEDSGNIELSWE
jgi:hypothetical protein